MAKYSTAEEQEAAAPGDRVAAVSPDAAVDAPPPANDQAPEAEAPPVAPEPEQAPAADAAPTAVDEGPPLGRDGKPLYSLGDNVPPDTAMPQPKKDKSEDDIFGRIGEAIHGGITGLMDIFGLSDKDAAVRDPARFQQGQKAVVDGLGAGKPEDIKALQQTVDPEGRLTHAQVMIQAMTEGYEYYMERGDPTRANNYAAMIIQYSAHEASVYASKAVRDLRAGNMKGAAENASRATSSVVGQDTESTVVHNPQTGNFDATEKDVMTGKTVAKHELTGQQLFNLAMGAANKSSIWQGLMDAASSRPGYAKPAKTFNDADNQKLADVKAGINPDRPGTGPAAVDTGVTSRGNAPVAPANLRPESQAQLKQMMPTYDTMILGGESRGGNNYPATAGHKAAGIYQIQPDEWETTTGHNPYVKGPDGTIHDERLNKVLAKQVFEKFTARNAANFEKDMGRMPTLGELAMMHQQGYAGGTKLIKAAEAKPDALATSVVPKDFLAQNGMKDPKITVADAVSHIQNYYLKYAGQGAGGAPSAPGAPVRVAQNMTPGSPMTDASTASATVAPPTAPEAVPVGRAPIPMAAARSGPVPARGAPNPFAAQAPLPGDRGPTMPQPTQFTPKLAPHWTPGPGQSQMGKNAVDAGNRYWQGQTDKENAAAKFNLQQGDVAALKAYKDEMQRIKDNIGKEGSTTQRDSVDAFIQKLTPVEGTPDGIKFSQLAPETQNTIKNTVFSIAMRNPNFPPGRIYKAAISLATPPEEGRRPGFTVHATPRDDFKRVRFNDGETILISTGQLNELSGAMGNENYLRRIGVEKKEQGQAQTARDMAVRAEKKKKAGGGLRGLAIGLGETAEGGPGLMTVDRALPDDEFAAQ